jgi:hypothetical protein
MGETPTKLMTFDPEHVYQCYRKAGGNINAVTRMAGCPQNWKTVKEYETKFSWRNRFQKESELSQQYIEETLAKQEAERERGLAEARSEELQRIGIIKRTIDGFVFPTVPELNEDGTPRLDENGQPILRPKVMPTSFEQLVAKRVELSKLEQLLTGEATERIELSKKFVAILNVNLRLISEAIERVIEDAQEFKNQSAREEFRDRLEARFEAINWVIE